MELPNAVLETILHDARVKQYPQGQIVLYEGDSPVEVYIVKSGYVKVYDVDAQGNEKALSIVKPGDIMPYAFFSGKGVLNKWFYQALCDTDIYVLERETLIKAMYTDTDLILSIVSGFSKEVHEILTRLSSLGKSRAQAKLIALMKYFVVCVGKNKTPKWWRVPFPVNQQFLADLTGMTRETCATSMKELLNQGVVRAPKVNLLEINTVKLQDL